MSETLDALEVELDDLEDGMFSAEFDPAELASPDADYFSIQGHRQLALDMLIDAARTIQKNPASKNAKFERDWLEGKEDDCLIPANMCFEAVVGGNIDVTIASTTFIRALDSNPNSLLKALHSARRKLVADTFDVVDSSCEVRVSASAYRPRMGD